MSDILELISPDEARKMTRDRDIEMLNNKIVIVNKAINKACHCGYSYAMIHESYIDNKVSDILRKSGYSLEYDQMDGNVKISWYEEDE